MDNWISTSWLLTLGWTSLIAGVLACAVMLVQRAAQGLLSPLCCCALSALVILRLLIPGNIESVHGFLPEDGNLVRSVTTFAKLLGDGIDASDAAKEEMDLQDQGLQMVPLFDEANTAGSDAVMSPSAISTVAAAGSEGSEGQFSPETGKADANKTFSNLLLSKPHWHLPSYWLALLKLMWITGVCLVLLLACARHGQMVWFVGRHARSKNRTALRLLRECKKATGVTRRVQLVEPSCFSVPAVFGLFRPVIILPANAMKDLSAQEMRHIFLHELAHIRNHDVAINWMLIVLRALHWFNPLVRLGLQKFIADREGLRDSQVLAVLSKAERASYGHTLLKMAVHLQPTSRIGLAHSAVPFLSKKQEIKRRIQMISQNKMNNRLGLPFALLAGATLSFGAFTMKAQDLPEVSSGSPSEPLTSPKDEEDKPGYNDSELDPTFDNSRQSGTDPDSSDNEVSNTLQPNLTTKSRVPKMLSDATSLTTQTDIPLENTFEIELASPYKNRVPAGSREEFEAFYKNLVAAGLKEEADELFRPPSLSNRVSEESIREKQLESAYKNLIDAGLKEEAARVQQHLQLSRAQGKANADAELEAQEIKMQMEKLEERARKVEMHLLQIHKEMKHLQDRMGQTSTVFPSPEGPQGGATTDPIDSDFPGFELGFAEELTFEDNTEDSEGVHFSELIYTWPPR